MNAKGVKLSCVRVANDPVTVARTVADAVDGRDAEVVIEGCDGWYWAVDLLQADGYRVHLAHPAGNDWGKRRVKNDERDARDLADLCRLGRLAEAWIAPPHVRELRELVRYRARLVELRSGLKSQVHAVMAKEGVLPTHRDIFCKAATPALDAMALGPSFELRVESLRDVIAVYDREIAIQDPPAAERRQGLSGHPGPQRDRPHHRRHPGGRDRRREPLPLARRTVLVGRCHAPPP